MLTGSIVRTTLLLVFLQPVLHYTANRPGFVIDRLHVLETQATFNRQTS